MGRHTKLADEADLVPEVEEPPAKRRLGWLLSLPLLPITALIVAVGVVVAAVSTSQISLNFAGGTPAQNQPRADAQDDGAARGANERTSRNTRKGLLVAFRATRRLETGFEGTVTIANHGAKPVDGWTLAFKIPNAKVLSVSNAVLVKTGTVATLRGGAIQPGQRVRIGFVAQGAASKPSACLINRTRCVLA
ncbi:cellulose binding domain-containing protein [Actinomadura craniellae]|nr:cellulose binding domain-containing protein [Actinomadura craniellae]